MRITFCILITAIIFSSCTRHIYIVRHAEKIAPTDSLAKNMGSDLPLSEAGKVRSLVLKDELKHKHIKHIYSTNTIRTISTAEPLSHVKNIPIEKYKSMDSLVAIVKNQKGNTLIVGHSNTVDDLVNKICGEVKVPADLKDGEYDNLFIITVKKKKMLFKRKKYGYPSNPSPQ